MDDNWRNDFDLFLNGIAERIRSGETPSDLSREFTGETVLWCGILGRKTLDGEAPSVLVGSVRKDLDLGDGPTAQFAGLTMPVADRSIANWERVELDAKVTFTARLGARMGVFPTIEVKRLPTGRVILSIRLTEAAPA
jgi:hypothetical protein